MPLIMWRWIGTIIAVLIIGIVKCQFYECHDDPGMSPEDGPLNDMQFTWLGALQYIHVKNGTPHFFRVPRVILISRQFALSTAIDAGQVPEDYALGNVAFSDYERDEVECGLSMHDLTEGAECEAAILLVPIADVLLHPEFKHFAAKNSIALLKLVTPVKSRYMLPACLPFKNWLVDKKGRQTREKIVHVDFVADVPRDFTEEEKDVSRISLLPKELCYLFDPKAPENSTKITRNRMVCTTGCGFHSGAPTLVHEHTGHWSLVSIATGGPPCPDALRTRRPPPPPHHITIFPYVSWITAAITGKAVGAFAKDDPFGYIMPRVSSPYDLGHTWLGHWWMGGSRCYDRGDNALDMFKFYHEIFSLKPITTTYMNYYLEIYAPMSTQIICVKVGMPYRYATPKVWELDSPVAQVQIPLLKFRSMYRFQVEAWGYNTTASSSFSEEQSYVQEYEDEELAIETMKRPYKNQK